MLFCFLILVFCVGITSDFIVFVAGFGLRFVFGICMLIFFAGCVDLVVFVFGYLHGIALIVQFC